MTLVGRGLAGSDELVPAKKIGGPYVKPTPEHISWLRKALGLTREDLGIPAQYLPSIKPDQYLIPKIKHWHKYMERR